MKIAVIGAGIAGTATAFELASHGMQVTVLERRSAVAEGGSFAGAGVVATSLVRPLDLLPESPTGWMQKLNPRSGITLKKGASLQDFWWRYRRLSVSAEQSSQHHAISSELIAFNQEKMREILKHLPVGLERSAGQIVVFQDEAQVRAWQPKLQRLKELGGGFQILTPQATRKLETGLSQNLTFHGAVFFEQDEVINGRQYVQALKDEAMRYGAQFQLDTLVASVENGPVLHFENSQIKPPQSFDAVVICCSSDSAKLLRKLDSSIVLSSVQSYSVSGQIHEPLNAPRSAVFDARSGTSITRTGNRIRLSGGFEMGHSDNPLDEKVVNGLYKTLQDFFPGAIQFHGGEPAWRGLSSFSADGLPLVGQTHAKGVWVNAGHGMSGLSMSNACADVIREGIQMKPESTRARAISPTRFRLK